MVPSVTDYVHVAVLCGVFFYPGVCSHPQCSAEDTEEETLCAVTLLFPRHRTLFWSVDRRCQE